MPLSSFAERCANFSMAPEWLTPTNRRLYSAPVLMVVEGVHDIEFLRRVHLLLRHADPGIVDFRRLEQLGRLIFIPQGGGNVLNWTDRLSPLGCPQMHLYDRESEPATKQRNRAVELINRQPNCRAFVTSKRALENYLHPAALWECRRIAVDFGDSDDVAATVARRTWERACKPLAWEQLPPRARYRLRAKAKHWLNTDGVMHMTLERLAERDPRWEIMSWFTAVGELLRHSL